MISLLIIDNAPGSLKLLSEALAQPGLEGFTASNLEERQFAFHPVASLPLLSSLQQFADSFPQDGGRTGLWR